MRRVLIFCLMFLPIQSWAATLPVTYAVRNSVGEVIMYAPTTTYTKTLTVANPELPFVTNSMEITTAAVVSDKLQRIGFRPDDPRVGLTIDAIQKEAISTATGAAGAGFTGAAIVVLTGAALGTPVGWGVIGASALVGVLGYGIQKLVTGGLDWLFNSDGTVTLTGTSPDLPAFTSGFRGPKTGTIYTSLSGACSTAESYSTDSGGCSPWTVYWVPAPDGLSCDKGGYSASCSLDQPPPSWGNSGRMAGVDQEPDFSWQGTSDTTLPVKDSVAGMPDSERVLPVTDRLIADLTNANWRSAYARDPSILPPSAISDTDVSGVRAQNPSVSPRGDNLTSSPGSFSPTSSPTSPVSTAPGASVNPGTGGLVGPGIPSPSAPAPTASTPKVDLGVDPNIGAPGLEATPTAQQILNPILNLFPDLKSFVVPAHSAVCPMPSMTLFGNSLVLDGHCALLETVRPTLYAVMAFVWVVIGLFIILAA